MKAVVVGGGIGGLACALALRGRGWDVSVCERRPDRLASQAGNGLVIWHNGVLALDALGLSEPIRRIGRPLHSYRFRSWRDPILANWSLDDPDDGRGVPVLAVSRPLLHGVLADAVGDDLHTGRQCVAVEPGRDDRPPRVTLADGGRLDADVVVGADGLRSAVRAALVPNEPPPRFARMKAYQGLARDVDLGVAEGAFVNTFGPGGFFVHYRVGDDLVYWDGVVGDGALRPSLLRQPPRALVETLFGGWPDPIPRLLAAASVDGIQPIDIFDRAPLTRWGWGGITLLGDAAHPMTFNLGQGANQALEDAVVLGSHLGGAADAGAVRAALRAYEAARIARTTPLVLRSRANGNVSIWRSPQACVLRDGFMRVAFPRLIRRVTYSATTGAALPPELMSPSTTPTARQGVSP